MNTSAATRSRRCSIRPLGEPGDLGWVVKAHGEVYATEYGWDVSFERLVARIVADFADRDDDPRAAAWVAELGGARVGCVFCVPADDAVSAQLRILLVHPDGRGRGLGGALVDTAVAFARACGYERMLLWTNHPLRTARHIYLSRGFELVDEQPHHSFGVDLIGQTYALELRSSGSDGSDAVAIQSRC
jgi:GNAT superfamily N-acetyltransferase